MSEKKITTLGFKCVVRRVTEIVLEKYTITKVFISSALYYCITAESNTLL